MHQSPADAGVRNGAAEALLVSGLDGLQHDLMFSCDLGNIVGPKEAFSGVADAIWKNVTAVFGEPKYDGVLALHFVTRAEALFLCGTFALIGKRK
jgi:hypothetical protein